MDYQLFEYLNGWAGKSGIFDVVVIFFARVLGRALSARRAVQIENAVQPDLLGPIDGLVEPLVISAL